MASADLAVSASKRAGRAKSPYMPTHLASHASDLTGSEEEWSEEEGLPEAAAAAASGGVERDGVSDGGSGRGDGIWSDVAGRTAEAQAVVVDVTAVYDKLENRFPTSATFRVRPAVEPRGFLSQEALDQGDLEASLAVACEALLETPPLAAFKALFEPWDKQRESSQ